MCTPLVSVIIPVYNVERLIERCIRSLMNQTLQDIEFIFVDDCTPDNSIDILRRVVKEYPTRIVRIIKHDKNLGLAAARKTGILAANGRYIAHCDSNDWVHAEMYQVMVEEALKNKADIVTSAFFLEKGAETNIISYPYTEETQQEIFNPSMFGWIYGAIWNKLITKELYVSNSIYPIEGINMWEDSVLTLRLRLASHKTIVLSQPFYHYWVGERKSSFFSTNDMRKVDEMVKATNYIESFVKNNDLRKFASLYISKMKLSSKERLLSEPSWLSFTKWKTIFPEADLEIWKLPGYGLQTKIKISLLHFLPKQLAYAIFRLRRK